MIRAVVFDCFGVLWSDDLAGIFAHRTGNSPQAKRALRTLSANADTGRITNEQFWQQLALLMEVSPAQCRELVDARRTPNESLFSFIATLRPTYKVGLLSNAGADIWGYLPPERRQYFDACVISAEVGIAKPDRRIFEAICVVLGVLPQEVLFVDDSSVNCQAAQELGMRVFCFGSLDALRGAIPAP